MSILYSRVTKEIAEMAQRLAQIEKRSISSEIAFLIQKEYEARFSDPNPEITIEDATKAVKPPDLNRELEDLRKKIQWAESTKNPDDFREVYLKINEILNCS